MGDPKKPKKKYTTPDHPFRKARIDIERVFKKEYGLKNKTELWKMNATLKRITRQAKKIIGFPTAQNEKERLLLMTRLSGLGLLDKDADVGLALNLTAKDILERRLQTQVVKRQLARSMKQARQFIVHGHILVGGKKVTAPSYLVKVVEEPSISFVAASTLASPEHPERTLPKAQQTPADPVEKTAEAS